MYIKRSFFTDIGSELYGTKPKSVHLHVLPVIASLLEKAAPGRAPAEQGTLRYSTINLVQSIHAKMGDSLFEWAKNTSTVTPRMQGIMGDMLDIDLP